MKRRLIPLVTAVMITLLTGHGNASDIAITKHNLSASSGNAIRAMTEDQICVFCHTPHNANPAVGLWNHPVNSNSYTVYTTGTIRGDVLQPSGSTKLCLSCHDGTIALGSLVTATDIIPMVGTAADGTLPTNTTNLGTDLRNDHPVSITVQNIPGQELRIPTLDPAIKYVTNQGQVTVECTSCHDPHNDAYGKFLRKYNIDIATGKGSQICLACHEKLNWQNTVHFSDTKLYNNTPIQESACANCHSVHNSKSYSHLLNRDDSTEYLEQVCLDCHGPNGITQVNIVDAFNFSYNHPTLIIDGVHQGEEVRGLTPDQILAKMAAGTTGTVTGTHKHAECVDCHGPHSIEAEDRSSNPVRTSKISPALLGTWGLKPYWDSPESQQAYAEPNRWEVITFTDITDIDALEAYLCFKCHPEKAQEFNPYNASFHAVMADRGGMFVSQASGLGIYRSPWIATAAMKCTHCHSSSNGTFGPHGSLYNHIISKPFYRTTNSDGKGGTTPISSGDLCHQCHDLSTTGFVSNGRANLHMRKHEDRACTSCHAVHGSRFAHLLSSKDGPIFENRNSLQTLKVDSINNVERSGSGWDQHKTCALSGCG